ncbi:MAG: TolC family protein [Bacteroidales bacterium]|nr:TolC family protein [Bacteroidales bacterium]
MKKPAALIFCLILTAPGLFGGTPLSLETCREAARRTGHFEELSALVELDRQIQATLADSPYRLSMNAYGQASYQTDAPNPASMTDFPFVLHPSPKFQYHAGVLLSQLIYGGGGRRLRQDLSELEQDLKQAELDGQEFESDSMVDELYLGILLARKRDEILTRQLNSVRIKLSDARKAYENGMVYKDAVLSLEAQCSRLEADLAGNAAQTSGAISVLSELTGLPMDVSTEFELPRITDPMAGAPDPNLTRLDLEIRRIGLNKELVRSAAMPSLRAFGTVGYGRWPLNFFDRNPDFYGIVGLTLLVPITGWRDVRQTSSYLDNAARRVELQRDNLDRRRRVALLKYDGEIARYDDLIAANGQTVSKCEELCEELDTLSSRGAVPLSDYLTALEQLSAARLDGELYAMLKLQQQLLRMNYISKL